MDERQPKTVLDKMAEVNDTKYTVDNVYFYDTMAELQRWAEGKAGHGDCCMLRALYIYKTERK